MSLKLSYQLSTPLIVHVVKSLPYHMLSTVRRGYTHMKQNEIRDNFAKIMHDVCYDVEVEPAVQLLQGESFIQNYQYWLKRASRH